IALAIFLAGLRYLGWSGGSVGGAIADGVRAVVGVAAYALPLALLVIGGLLVARSSLVDVRPFRTGLMVGTLGLMLVLGSEDGGYVGRALDTIFGRLLGRTGGTIPGATAPLPGVPPPPRASIG